MAETFDRPTVFLDFDGTISRVDVVDAILEAHADRAWQEVEDEWRAGRIGSRACLAAQLALVRATVPELETLLGRVETDPGFGPLLQACAVNDVPAHIISDGFDYCIQRILARTAAGVQPLVGRMQVCASHLEPCGETGWRTAFPFYAETCAHGCATCKPAVMQALNPAGGPTVFVGDGLSDRYAAAAADVVFAKDKLAGYCADQGIPHVRYASLADVAAYMDEAMRSGRMWRRATAAPARA